MLDRDESALHSVQMALEGRALLDSENLVVADIRDRTRMREVFDKHRPHVVFHTAALKHLPLLEMHPAEAVKELERCATRRERFVAMMLPTALPAIDLYAQLASRMESGRAIRVGLFVKASAIAAGQGMQLKTFVWIQGRP